MTLLAGDRAADLGAELRSLLEARGAKLPRIAFVLGSGLGAFADTLDAQVAVSFDDLEAMPKSTVPGHAGRFVAGEIEGVPVLCQQGRVHLYEGWSVEVVTRAVRSMSVLGVETLLLTNAAGGLIPDWPVPCLMRIADHINMQGVTPLLDAEASVGSPYSAAVAEALDGAARTSGVMLRKGTYVGLPGPSYETAAEIRMLQATGSHAVGMSTVQEAMAAWAGGLRVGAISCITNPGAGIAAAPLNHEEVVEAGQAIAKDFAFLLRTAVPLLAPSLD